MREGKQGEPVREGRRGERDGARSCRGYRERITASHDGQEWETKTRPPYSINCSLRETDTLGGGFGKETNLAALKWRRTFRSPWLHIAPELN